MLVHDEFLELCAVSVTGELTEDEEKRLSEHLSICSSCREALQQYRETAATVVPQLASELPLPNSVDCEWSEEKAEAALFKRIDGEERTSSSPVVPYANRSGNPDSASMPPPRWGQFGTLYAAGILMFVSLAICAYRIGEKRGAETTAVPSADSNDGLESAKRALSDARHERQSLLAQIGSRDRSIADLKQQLGKRGDGPHGGGANPTVEPSRTGGGPVSVSQPSSAQMSSELLELRNRLDREEKKRTQEVARASLLEAKVAELTKELQDREGEVARQSAAVKDRDYTLQQRERTIAQQDELLAHDRDIRDLMSARDLYIAEVYDVNKTGETNKPYGRVFYTRGKSLLFYAYDLDQQAGLKKASTFQAWGRREGGQDQPVNLGILYEDSGSNRRWVVKSEDQKTLEQIDAVFVTVEPNGGSRRPSGKPLLFASLRIHPNHP